MSTFLPKASKLPFSNRETGTWKTSGPTFHSRCPAFMKWRLCLGSSTLFSFRIIQFPVSHGKRTMPRNNHQKKKKKVPKKNHKVQWCASVANRESLCFWKQLWHACQKGPSSHVILSVSQGSLCKGKFSWPASYWGQPRIAALQKIESRRRKCVFSAFSPAFLLPPSFPASFLSLFRSLPPPPPD